MTPQITKGQVMGTTTDEGPENIPSLPPLPADVTDPTTAQMCREAGHSCAACPTRVRDLGATAHNALGAVRAALAGTGSWERARRKLGELERSLEKWQESVDAHFAAMDEWRKP